MALEQFRPTIWSRQLIVDTEKAFVFRNIANTDYEGEARFGNAVKINELGDVSVSTYGSTGISGYDDLTDAQKTLYIDQQKYFSFKVDDIARAQSNVEFMQGAMNKAAFAIADTVDQYIAALYSEHGLSDSDLGDSSTGIDVYAAGVDTDGLLNVITKMHQVLDEGNAPTQGRWVVVPPWVHAYMKFAGIVDNLAGGMKDFSGGNYGNGFIGNLLGFNWFVSNNVSNDGTDYRCMFGTPDAIGFVGQVEKIETIRLEDYFADGVRGLYVYGAKVIRPDHLGTAYLAAGGLTT